MNNKTNIFNRLKAYKLNTQVIIAFILLILFFTSFGIYFIPAIHEHAIFSELVLALFTSILVSFITVILDIIIEYNKNRKNEYLETLREFGIGNLYLNKETVLHDLLCDCDRKIWISGYRLILTNKLRGEFKNAILRGADFYALICPPWSDAFKMVYGRNEKVIDNYLRIFHDVNQARITLEKSSDQVKVVFVNKPIFNDTYRIDQHTVTGPYMHNKDTTYNVLMAKDFFSYDIVRESKLSSLVNDEYLTLFQEAEQELDWDKFEIAYEKITGGDFRESEKIELIKEALVERTDPQNDRKRLH